MSNWAFGVKILGGEGNLDSDLSGEFLLIGREYAHLSQFVNLGIERAISWLDGFEREW